MNYANFHVFALLRSVVEQRTVFDPGPGSPPLAQFSYRRKLVCRGGKEGEGGVATTAAVKEEREQRRNLQNVTSVS